MNEQAYALTFNEFFGQRIKADDEKVRDFHVIFSFVVAVSKPECTPDALKKVGDDIIDQFVKAKSIEEVFEFEYNSRPVHAETVARFIRTKFENNIAELAQLQNLTISVTDNWYGSADKSDYVTL